MNAGFIKYFTDLFDKCCGGERFLNKICPGFQHTLVDDRILCVTGHIKHFEFRVADLDFVVQHLAIGILQNDVGEQ